LLHQRQFAFSPVSARFARRRQQQTDDIHDGGEDQLRSARIEKCLDSRSSILPLRRVPQPSVCLRITNDIGSNYPATRSFTKPFANSNLYTLWRVKVKQDGAMLPKSVKSFQSKTAQIETCWLCTRKRPTREASARSSSRFRPNCFRLTSWMASDISHEFAI
jgi:hypothetical protein